MRAHIPSSIRRILRSVESQSAFLRCRGLELPRPKLPDVYARFLVERTFCSCGAKRTGLGGRSPENAAERGRGRESRGGERIRGSEVDAARRRSSKRPEAPDGEDPGYDARDPAGVRYRVVGRKLERRSREVIVPGVPRRGFDRLVLVRFDSAYHVLFAGMAAAVDFLRASEYREDSNEWALPLWSPFWSEGDVQDVTDVFRAAAAQVAMEDTPFVEPWRPGGSGPADRPLALPTLHRRRSSLASEGRHAGESRRDGDAAPDRLRP